MLGDKNRHIPFSQRGKVWKICKWEEYVIRMVETEYVIRMVETEYVIRMVETEDAHKHLVRKT